MTVRDLAGAMLRRWYIVIAALTIAGVGGYHLYLGQGVYSTETVVSFVYPGETRLSRYSGLDDANLIAFAGIVARAVDNGRSPVLYSEDTAPLYGAGVRERVVVALPNSGNQWFASYQRAEVVLQIVGPSQQWVARTQDDLLTKIVQVSNAQQASVASGVSLIQVAPVETTKTIYHVLPSRTSTIAAFLALFSAALIVGGWVAVVIDGAVGSRKTRSRRRHLANEGSER